MSQLILIMGLPGSGKTTCAQSMYTQLTTDHALTVEWFNADKIREQFNDWDFSVQGRLRQASRMRSLADQSVADLVLVDMVAPLLLQRELLKADYVVWMDTIAHSTYADTNQVFSAPDECDFHLGLPDMDFPGTCMSTKLGILVQHIIENSMVNDILAALRPPAH
jgi:adenylylsulfate kinase